MYCPTLFLSYCSVKVAIQNLSVRLCFNFTFQCGTIFQDHLRSFLQTFSYFFSHF